MCLHDNMNPTFIILLTTLLGIAVASVRYDNYALYRIIPKDVEDLNNLQLLYKSSLINYDFWTVPRGVGIPVDVLVPPEQKTYIEKLIDSNGMDFEILMENIQENIDDEARINKLSVGADENLTWDAYYGIDTINNWLTKLARENPNTVTLLDGGRSYENRTILGVKVSFPSSHKKKGVWIDSNIHAREWISSAATTYILNTLLYSDDPVIQLVAKSRDWYFFPVLNPDGYEYSRTDNRMWRKNRAPAGTCVGVDLNRNWDYKWNADGQASAPCREDYAGTGPFSEIESKTLAQFISTVADDLVLFITVHSYSQLILIPYGDSPKHADNYDVTFPAALKAARSLATRYGTRYEVGNTVEILYQAYGGSDDWAKAANQIPFVYTYELRDTGRYGFLLPANQIIPSGLETLDSIVTLLQEADKLY